MIAEALRAADFSPFTNELIGVVLLVAGCISVNLFRKKKNRKR